MPFRSMADRPKSWLEMVGEALRETAVLWLVFGLLDKYVNDDEPSTRWIAVVGGVSLACFMLGAVLERNWRN